MQPVKNNASKTATGMIVKINAASLQGLFFGLMCWVMWPESRFDYGWGFLAIISGLISCSFITGAALGMIRLYKRDKALEQYMQQGATPKSSTLASDDALKNAGMR